MPAVAEYFAGERHEFDLPLHAAGTEFQRQVWAALREIPYGETASYGELAELLGSPRAARAVGLANGRNPIGIVVTTWPLCPSTTANSWLLQPTNNRSDRQSAASPDGSWHGFKDQR